MSTSPKRGRPRYVYLRAEITEGLHAPDEDRWLSASVAAEQFGLSRSLFYLWRKNGRSYLGGCKLRARKRAIVKVDGKRDFILVYTLDQLERIDEKRTSLLVADPDAEWLSGREASERFGFDRNRLYEWHKEGCCYLDGRKLSARRVLAGIGTRARRIWQYLRSHLEEIARRSKQEDRKKPCQDKHGSWLPASVAAKRYRIFEQSLELWPVKLCGLLGGRTIRAKQVSRSAQTKHGGLLWVYFECDLRDIVAARKRAATYEDRAGTWLFACEAERRYGLRADNLWSYRRKTYPSLPQRKIRAKQVSASHHPCPRHPQRLYWVVHEGDIRQILGLPPLESANAQHGLRSKNQSTEMSSSSYKQSLLDCAKEFGPLQGKEIASKLGYPFNSYFRGALSGLCKRGLLTKTPDGYRAQFSTNVRSYT